MWNKSSWIALTCVGLMIVASMLWLDQPVGTYFRMLGQTTPQLVAPFKAITDAGKSQWFLVPLGVYMAAMLAMCRIYAAKRAVWRAHIAKAGFVFASLAISGLATDGIKILVGRPRPTLLAQDIFNQFTPFIHDAKWWSFPSGHSTSVMALALAVNLITPRWRWPFLFFAGVIMSSRIIIAAHYPADVLGGIVVALVVHDALRCQFFQRGWLKTPPTRK